MDIIYDYAMSFVGKPYLWGGDDPMTGFDCSGLVVEILQAMGSINHGSDYTAHDLYRLFEHSCISSPELGVLAFYGSVAKITHVGFCLDDRLMLESGGGGSRTTTLQAAIDQNAYIRIRPFDSRSDLVGLKWPQRRGLKPVA